MSAHCRYSLILTTLQNFINPSTIRDINSLRQDFLASLNELGYVPNKRDLSSLNANSDNENLLKAILTGAFYPRVAMIRPPDARFEKIQAGALVKEVCGQFCPAEYALMVVAARSQGSQVLRRVGACLYRMSRLPPSDPKLTRMNSCCSIPLRFSSASQT